MKKLLILILLILLLSGCQSTPQKSIEGWVFYYAEQAYREETEEIFGYIIEEYKLYDKTCLENYTCQYFRITLVNDGGYNTIYNIYIVYKKSFFVCFEEDRIFDVNIDYGH